MLASARLLARVEARARRELDADVEHRQIVDSRRNRRARRAGVCQCWIGRQRRARRRATARRRRSTVRSAAITRDRPLTYAHERRCSAGGAAAGLRSPKRLRVEIGDGQTVVDQSTCCATSCTCAASLASASRRAGRSPVRTGRPFRASRSAAPGTTSNRAGTRVRRPTCAFTRCSSSSVTPSSTTLRISRRKRLLDVCDRLARRRRRRSR